MAEESWRTVANRLAARMFNHAFCERHRETDPEPDCPACADRAAYRAWEAKGGSTHREAPYRGKELAVLADYRLRKSEER